MVTHNKTITYEHIMFMRLHLLDFPEEAKILLLENGVDLDKEYWDCYNRSDKIGHISFNKEKDCYSLKLHVSEIFDEEMGDIAIFIQSGFDEEKEDIANFIHRIPKNEKDI